MGKRKAFGISKDLNEGISHAISVVKNNIGALRYEFIPLVKIKFDPENPRQLAIQHTELLDESLLSSEDPLYDRKKKELDSLKSLASSIKKSGVRNAVEVFKDGLDYRLISGERRVIASLLAGKENIQARILDDKPSEFDIRYLQWIENIEREDLTLWERIQNVEQIILAHQKLEQKGVTASALKDILGCSLPHAMTYLAVVNAPADIRELLRSNRLTSLDKAAFLAKISDSALRAYLIEICLERQLSLSELKKHYHNKNKVTTSVTTSQSQKVKGRIAKRVTLGFTGQIEVAKRLMELIIAQPQYCDLDVHYSHVNWDDYSSVSRSFQYLIKQVEQRI